jgi:hypothetical protein
MDTSNHEDSSNDPAIEQLRRPPSIGLGILTIILGIPFVAFDVMAAISGEFKSVLGKAAMVAILLFFVAVPAHFFFGHRIRWILPGLVVVMGVVFTWYGIAAPDLAGVALGIPLVLVGIAWNVPSASNNPFVRWLADNKKYLTQNYSRKKGR